MKTINVPDLARFCTAFGTIGLRGGRRTGTDKLTQDDEEWFVARRFLKEGLRSSVFVTPFNVRKGIPPAEPDFVLEFADGNTVTFLEITKATHPADQREMTEFERSGKSAMRPGDFGGRFSRGVSQPGKAWASDVLDAIKRKAGKAIFCMSDANRHLVINPESNASFLLFYDNAEIDAFRFLSEVIGMERALYIKAVNGCLVHVLGKEYVCFDLLGEARLIKREVSDLSI